MPSKKGKLFIISAPSGCGKTTLCKKLLGRMPHMRRSVSLTTRPLRKGERNKRDYFFVTKKEFEKEVSRKNLLEWTVNFGHFYGTPKNRVLRLLSKGIDVILAIDVKGAMKIKKLYPNGVFIFVLPPSIADLKKRLKERKTDDKINIAKRMKVARKELSYLPRYIYALVNDDLKETTDKLEAIVTAERCKLDHYTSGA